MKQESGYKKNQLEILQMKNAIVKIKTQYMG